MASSSSSSCVFFLPRNRTSWIAVLVPPASLIFAMVSGHSVVSISITYLALVISTAIWALKNPKPNSNKNQSSSEIKKVAEQKQSAVSEDVDGIMGQIQNLYCDDPSSSSEDYSDIDSTTTHCSDDDGSIYSDEDDDDEESLFEISLLPCSGHFVGNEKENSKVSCLQQHCLVEFLTDMNEEDNMIEIDISMGSIKCSGFQIEA